MMSRSLNVAPGLQPGGRCLWGRPPFRPAEWALGGRSFLGLSEAEGRSDITPLKIRGFSP
jgi:hypothetical protein